MQDVEIVIIGAAIIDVLAQPVSREVFETGSYPAEDIHMTTGADALNEATILAGKGRSVQLETVIGQVHTVTLYGCGNYGTGCMYQERRKDRDEYRSCGKRRDKKFSYESAWDTAKSETGSYTDAISGERKDHMFCKHICISADWSE